MAIEAAEPRYRWSVEDFLHPWDVGAFGERRVELVGGEVWSASPVGSWHGATAVRVIRTIPEVNGRS